MGAELSCKAYNNKAKMLKAKLLLRLAVSLKQPRYVIDHESPEYMTFKDLLAIAADRNVRLNAGEKGARIKRSNDWGKIFPSLMEKSVDDVFTVEQVASFLLGVFRFNKNKLKGSVKKTEEDHTIENIISFRERLGKGNDSFVGGNRADMSKSVTMYDENGDLVGKGGCGEIEPESERHEYDTDSGENELI